MGITDKTHMENKIKRNTGLFTHNKIIDGRTKSNSDAGENHGIFKSGNFLKVFTSIRAKMILAFMVPVVFIIVLGILSYSKSAEGLVGSYENNTLSIMTNMSKYLNFGFEVVSSKANHLNSNKILKGYYSGQYKSSAMDENGKFREIQSMISTEVLSEKYISNIYILSDYGTGISGNGTLAPRLVYKDFTDGEEGKRLINGGLSDIWVGNHPYLDKQAGETNETYAISYIKYLYDITNQPIGCIVLDIPYSFVKDSLGGSGLPDGSGISFISGDGREIVSGKVPQGYTFVKQDYYLNAVKSNSSEGFEYVTYNKGEYLFVYSKVDASGSMLCAVIPKELIVKKANEVKYITLFIVLTASIIAIAFGTIIASGFSKIIKKTIAVLQKAGSGDLTYQAVIHRKDEFHVLGLNINDMIKSMKNLIKKMTGTSATVNQSALAVSESSNVLVETTKNISNSVEDIEHCAVQQAIDAEKCLHQMADLAERISQVYTSTRNIEKITEITKKTVNDGMEIVDNLSLKVKDTSDATHSVIFNIENLEKESSAIMGIISTMNNIAAQTNLLSLNASIEAARAGEAGRGFNVVAEEIRKLAEKSMNAAGEIGNIIQNIGVQTKKTVMTVKYAENIVLSQEEALGSTVSVFTDIGKHFEDLINNFGQILSGIESIEHSKNGTLGAIESISASTEETAAAAEELGAIAGKQKEEVNRLDGVVRQLSEDATSLEESVKVFKIT